MIITNMRYLDVYYHYEIPGRLLRTRAILVVIYKREKTGWS